MITLSNLKNQLYISFALYGGTQNLTNAAARRLNCYSDATICNDIPLIKLSDRL
jgi:hypothetical protein